MLPTYNRTGWYTFFLVLSGILPATGSLFSLIQDVVNIADSGKNGGLLNFLMDAGLLALFIFYTKWLWEARSALITSQTTKHPLEALITAEASILKYIKVSTIVQIITLSLSAVGLILLMIFATILTQIH